MSLHRDLAVSDYLSILRRRVWWMVLPAIFFCMALYLVSLFLPNRYESQTLVLVEQQKVPDKFVTPVVTEQLNMRLATMQEQILSRTRLQPIIERFGLFKEQSGKAPMEDLVDQMRKAIKVSPIRVGNGNVPGFYISFQADNPRLAQQVCGEILSMFTEENIKQREQRAQGTTDFLTNQLDDAKRKLDDMDQRLATFKQEHIGQLPGEEQRNMTMLGTLNGQLDAVTQQLNRAVQDQTYLQALLGQQETAWRASQVAGGTAQVDTHDLEQQIATAQANLVVLEGRYTDDHPDVIKTKAYIARLQKQLKQSRTAPAPAPDTTAAAAASNTSPAPKELQTLRLQVQMVKDAIRNKSAEQQRLQAQIQQYQARIQSSPKVEEEYKSITRDHDTALEFYNQLLQKKTESEMATDLERRQQGEVFRVMDPPNLPERPTFPNRPLFAGAGFLGGAFLGFGIVMLLEMRDQNIRNESDVEFYLKLQTLAAIPPLDMAIPRNGVGRRLWPFGRGKKAEAPQPEPEPAEEREAVNV